MTQHSSDDSIVGTWRLVSCEARSNRGDTERLYGEEPFGRLMYGADGKMSAIITESKPRAGTSIVCDTPDTFAGFLAYCGSYRLGPETGKITHLVEGSSILSWVHTEQVRYFELSNRQLQIATAPYERNGQEWTSTLVWEKL